MQVIIFYTDVAIEKFVGAGSVFFDLRKSYCAVYTVTDQKIISSKLLPYLNAFLVLNNKIRFYEISRKNHFNAVPRKSIKKSSSYNPYWLCGFTDGDGSFHGIVRKQKDYKNNFQVTAVFDLAHKNSIYIHTHFEKINEYFFQKKAVI